MKRIGLDSWPRAGQYRFFRGYANPHFAITAPLDVTRLVGQLRSAGVPVFNACVYALTEAGNTVPEFRTRFRGDEIVEHKTVGASFTVPIDGGGFAFCEVGREPDWLRFESSCSQAIDAAQKQTALSDTTRDEDAWLFMSCLPWLPFSAMVHAVRGPDDCVPRIAWGQYSTGVDGRITIPVSVQCHHALIDGEHVGRFFAIAQDALDGLPDTAVA